MLPLMSMASSVLGGGEAGETDAKSSDTNDVSVGPITQNVGSGSMMTFEATDSWIWLLGLAVLAVVVLRK